METSLIRSVGWICEGVWVGLDDYEEDTDKWTKEGVLFAANRRKLFVKCLSKAGKDIQSLPRRFNIVEVC